MSRLLDSMSSLSPHSYDTIPYTTTPYILTIGASMEGYLYLLRKEIFERTGYPELRMGAYLRGVDLPVTKAECYNSNYQNENLLLLLL